jgi:hypothetical protein
MALTCDKVGIVGNGSLISIHGYVMQNSVKIPMLIFFQKIVGGIGAESWQPNSCDHGGLAKGWRIEYIICSSKIPLFWGWCNKKIPKNQNWGH